MKRVGRVLFLAFTAITSLLAIQNGVNEIMKVTSVLQLSVEIGDLLHGTLGVLMAIGVWRRRPWTATIAVSWAVAVVYTATIASFSFSDPTFKESGTVMGTVAAGVSTALVASLLAWAARVLSRPLSPAPINPPTLSA